MLERLGMVGDYDVPLPLLSTRESFVGLLLHHLLKFFYPFGQLVNFLIGCFDISRRGILRVSFLRRHLFRSLLFLAAERIPHSPLLHQPSDLGQV